MHGEQKHKKHLIHDAGQLWDRQTIWVMTSKALWERSRTMVMLWSPKGLSYKKWIGPPLCPTHVVFLRFGIAWWQPTPLKSSLVFFRNKRTDISKKKNPPNLWLCGKTPEHTRRKTQTLQFGCWSFKAVKWYSSFTSREAASQSSQSKVMFFLSLGLHHFKYMSAIHLVCKDITWL